MTCPNDQSLQLKEAVPDSFSLLLQLTEKVCDRYGLPKKEEEPCCS